MPNPTRIEEPYVIHDSDRWMGEEDVLERIEDAKRRLLRFAAQGGLDIGQLEITGLREVVIPIRGNAVRALVGSVYARIEGVFTEQGWEPR